MSRSKLRRRYSDADQYDLLLASCKSRKDLQIILDKDTRRRLLSIYYNYYYYNNYNYYNYNYYNYNYYNYNYNY